MLRAMSVVVVPRLPDSTAAADTSAGTQTVDPPAVMAIRLAFGVGTSDSPPTPKTFKTTYQLAIPVFSLGGLDPDGVYEFDAAALFETLSTRAQRRRWGVRLELELQQPASSVGRADLHVELPYPDDSGLTMTVLGQSGRGTPLPGGGRTVVVASDVITDANDIGRLSGTYGLQLSDQPPGSAEGAHVSSGVRPVRIDVTRFEFES